MKLTTVIGSANNNSNYYLFIPKQIAFWNKFGIKFIALFVGSEIPNELSNYSNNIILWNRNLDINSVYVAQNLRIYYTALLSLPDDEVVMITDMDMLPATAEYYTSGLNNYTKEDFIYYRFVDKNICRNEIYMCYNCAHPDTWGKVFNIKSEDDVESAIYKTYDTAYNGIPGSEGWFIDQVIMYNNLINYPHLKVLNRTPRRLEVNVCINHILNKHINFVKNYDDMHFHRNYKNNENLILAVEKQIL
jgi:hypothetical protein